MSLNEVKIVLVIGPGFGPVVAPLDWRTPWVDDNQVWSQFFCLLFVKNHQGPLIRESSSSQQLPHLRLRPLKGFLN